MEKFKGKNRTGGRAIRRYGEAEAKIFDGNFAILTDEPIRAFILASRLWIGSYPKSTSITDITTSVTSQYDALMTYSLNDFCSQSTMPSMTGATKPTHVQMPSSIAPTTSKTPHAMPK